MVCLGLDGRLSLVGLSSSCQDLLVLPDIMVFILGYHEVLGTWDDRYLKDTFDL